MHDERIFAERLLALGARGYLMKHEPPELFLFALRQVIAGKRYVKRDIEARTGRAGTDFSFPNHLASPLTAREHEVLHALTLGLGTQQIARHLNVSAKTVDAHRRNMREKLGLRSAGELVRYGMQWETSVDKNSTGP